MVMTEALLRVTKCRLITVYQYNATRRETYRVAYVHATGTGHLLNQRAPLVPPILSPRARGST